MTDTWTPKVVRTRLIEALTWAHYGVGPVGPAPMRSAMPGFNASFEDHMDEGWGIPERAEPDEERPRPPMPSAEVIAGHEAALMWAARYVAAAHPSSARMLGLWLMCKVCRRSFDREIKARRLHSAHAYRLRDRALSLISVGLDRDGVPL